MNFNYILFKSTHLVPIIQFSCIFFSTHTNSTVTSVDIDSHSSYFSITMKFDKKPETKIDFYSVVTDVLKLKNVEKEWSLEEALTHIGMGKMNYLLTFITGLIIAASMTETMGMNFIMKSAECDLELTPGNKGVLTSVGYVGILSAAFIWGYLSDTRGRRDIMKWTLFATSILSILSSFAPDFISFVVLRLLVGIFLSASIGSTYPYLGEFVPAKNRQMMMALASFFFGIAQIYIPAVAWLLFTFDFKISIFGVIYYRPWRLLIVVGALPGLVATIFLFFYPESPKYLIVKGLNKEALKALEWLFVKNTGKSSHEFQIKKLKIEIDPSHDPTRTGLIKSVSSQVMPLLRPPYVKHLLISFLIIFSLFFTHTSLGLWFMEIENDIYVSDTRGTICQILTEHFSNITHDENVVKLNQCDDTISEETYIDAFLLGSAYTLIFALISICLFSSALCGLALFWVTEQTLTLILFTLFLSFGGPVVSVTTGTAVLLFPTNHRAMALCIVLTMGRLGTVFGSNFIGWLLSVNCEATIGVLTGVVTCAAVLNFLLPFNE
uniref:CSON002523 protein n=1 Tax=Culicoides sonorensis TaxID=179676 RepID=A0A336LUV1_CULSO